MLIEPWYIGRLHDLGMMRRPTGRLGTARLGRIDMDTKITLEEMAVLVRDLSRKVRDLDAQRKAEEKKVRDMPLAIRGVFPGDVWVFPDNRGLKWGHLCKVRSVNGRRNRVEFEDDGWEPLDRMLSGKWVLVSRESSPEIEAMARQL